MNAHGNQPEGSAVTKELRLTLRIRNNRLITAREQLGLTPLEAAKKIGISYFTLLNHEALKRDPRQHDTHGRATLTGQLSKSAQKICAFYGLDWREIWPDAVLSVVKPVREVCVDVEQLKMLPAGSMRTLASEAASPEDEASDAQQHEQLRQYMVGLTPRQVQVLRYHYGLGGEDALSPSEIGRKLGLSRSRVGQILVGAERKIRKMHNARARGSREHAALKEES